MVFATLPLGAIVGVLVGISVAIGPIVAVGGAVGGIVANAPVTFMVRVQLSALIAPLSSVNTAVDLNVPPFTYVCVICVDPEADPSPVDTSC